MILRKSISLVLLGLLLAGCTSQPVEPVSPALPEAEAQAPADQSLDVEAPSPALTETLPTETGTPAPTDTPEATSTPTPTEEPPSPPGIILFIGDGMGPVHRQAAAWLVKGEGGLLAMDSLAVHGWAQTAPAGGTVTDSAAAGTAIATGIQSPNRVISMDADGNPLATILELAEQQGWATGLVTTVPMTHATPAVFASHVGDRSMQAEIAREMIAADVDVLLGGGEDDFFSKDENGCYHGNGIQPSGEGLVSPAIASGYTYLCTRDELLALTPSPGMKLLGLFAGAEIPVPIAPTLAEMTQAALAVLSQDPDGFFLMVEAGQIDWASHELQSNEAMHHTVGLDTAVTMAVIFTLERENTLLIVTADHETGGMSLNKDGSGSFRQDGPFHMPDGTPFWVDWTTTSHTEANIPVTAQGPHSEMLAGEYHLTRIFETMLVMLSAGQ